MRIKEKDFGLMVVLLEIGFEGEAVDGEGLADLQVDLQLNCHGLPDNSWLINTIHVFVLLWLISLVVSLVVVL